MITSSLIIVFILIIFLYVVWEVATFLTYGWFINKARSKRYEKLTGMRLSSLDHSVIITPDGYITTHPFSLFCKYHINSWSEGCRTVPYWNPLHKTIKEYFKK